MVTKQHMRIRPFRETISFSAGCASAWAPVVRVVLRGPKAALKLLQEL